MKAIQYRIEYLFVRLFDFGIRYLPEWFLFRFADFLGWVMDKLKYRKDVIDINLNIAFPEKSESERARIRHDFYRHFTRFFVIEFNRSPYYTNRFIEHRITVENADLIRRYSGQQMMFLSGHIGEFTLGSMIVMHILQDTVNVIIKQQKNPLTNAFFVNMRRRCNQKAIYAKGAIKNCLKVLKNGEHLGFLNDQNAGEKGILAPFFGVDTSNMYGLPIFAREFPQMPLIMTYCTRLKDGYYSVWFEELHRPKTDDPEEFAREIVTAYNQKIEAVIRQNPSQYLWSHRRWPLTHYGIQSKKSASPDVSQNPIDTGQLPSD